MAYNANEAFSKHFATLLDAQKTHNTSTDFSARVAAREVMLAAESKLAFAKRHITFCVTTSAATAMQLKMAQYAH